MHATDWIGPLIVLLTAILILRPRRKPPIHPIPANDSELLSRIRLRGKKQNAELTSIACLGSRS